MFKALVKVKLAESSMVIEGELRNTYEEALNDGEISKKIFEEEFISFEIQKI